MAVLRGFRSSRTHRHTQGQIREFPADHSKPQIGAQSELEQLGNELLSPLFPVTKGIRLLGISMSSLSVEEAEDDREFSLFALGSGSATFFEKCRYQHSRIARASTGGDIP